MKKVTLNEAAQLCRDLHRPISISVNGTDKLYLLDEKLYKEYLEAKEFEEVMKGVADIENGRFTDGDTFFEELNRKYGI